MDVLHAMEHKHSSGKPIEMGATVDWEARTIRFDPAGYEIDLNQIQDEGEIVYWVEHLADKNWITGPLIGEFVRAATTNLMWMRARKMA